MKVFISWSGPCSKAVANVLRTYLPRIVQAIEPWMSEADLASGERWQGEIGQRLEESDVGICVLTSDNFQQPWLNFEAGAISKSMKLGRPIPFLFDVKPSDISGPMTQFQARPASKEGLLEVLRDVNALLGERSLAPESLADVFSRFWSSIEGAFDAIRRDPTLASTEPASSRKDRELLEEILGLVRALHSEPGLMAGGASTVAELSAGLGALVGAQLGGGTLVPGRPGLTEGNAPPSGSEAGQKKRGPSRRRK